MIKIKEKKAKEYKFEDINDLDLFGYVGNVYMKLPKVSDYSGKSYNAICFDTNKYAFFCDGDHIVRYDAEIIVTKAY